MAWFNVLYGSDGRVPFQHCNQRLGTNIGDVDVLKAGKGRKQREGKGGKEEKGEKGKGKKEKLD